MHVLCKNKKCKAKITVSSKPGGSTQVSGVQVKGNVNISGGQIDFGSGGSISFGESGSISFGSPAGSEFICPECGHLDEYHPNDFIE